MTLAKHLYDLVHHGELSWDAMVSLKNYTTQSLPNGQTVPICLDLSVVGLDDSIIGSPLEFIPPSVVSTEQIEFAGMTSDDACSSCEEMPCE